MCPFKSTVLHQSVGGCYLIISDSVVPLVLKCNAFIDCNLQLTTLFCDALQVKMTLLPTPYYAPSHTSLLWPSQRAFPQQPPSELVICWGQTSQHMPALLVSFSCCNFLCWTDPLLLQIKSIWRVQPCFEFSCIGAKAPLSHKQHLHTTDFKALLCWRFVLLSQQGWLGQDRVRQLMVLSMALLFCSL